MKLLAISFLTLSLLACNARQNNFSPPANAFDAGREFLDAFFKGDFERAEFYMLKEDENNKILSRLKKEYRERSEHERKQFADASINVFDIEEVSPDVTIISYRNSYDKIARKLKVVGAEGTWMVDFKYTFNGNL